MNNNTYNKISNTDLVFIERVHKTVSMINGGELRGKECFSCVDWELITDYFKPLYIKMLINGIDNTATAKEVISAINERASLLQMIGDYKPQQQPCSTNQVQATNEAVSQNKEPQQEPTPESVEESLKPYFKPQFKGFAPDSTNYLKERFVPDLLILRGYSSKGIATFLLFAFNSNEFNKNNGKVKTFKDWLRVCSKAINKPISLNYKPSQLNYSQIANIYTYLHPKR